MVREIKGFVSGISYEKPLPRFIAAGVITILFHMFFLLFTPKATVNNDHGKKKKYVSLLPVNTSLLSEQKLLHWMDIMDPTYAVCPDRKHGFSLDIPKKIPDDLPVEIKKHFLQVQKGKFLPIRVPEQTKFEKVSKLWPYRTEPDFKKSARLPHDYYPALIPDNRTMPVVHFTKSEIEKIESLKKKNEKLKPAVLKISFPEKNLISETAENDMPPVSPSASKIFPRVQIIQSSGNPDLDRLALKKATFHFADNNNADYTVPFLITVQWNE